MVGLQSPARRPSGGARKPPPVSAEDVAARRLSQQTAVAELGQLALAGSELAALAQAACEAAAATLETRAVLVLEREAAGVVIRAGVGLAAGAIGNQLPAEETFSARVLRTGEPLMVPDVTADPEFVDTILSRHLDTGGVLVVPILEGRHAIATLTLVWDDPVFSDEDVSFVRSLANVVALAAERARVQSQLRISVDELRKSAEDRSRLLSHVVQAQEEERRRISDDIHDDSVQVMTAVALRLATLRRRLGGDSLDPLLLNLEHDVRQSIARLRRLMFVLRPPALESRGTAAALRAFLAQVTEDSGLSYTLEDRLTREPETDARIVVYRIAQEAVANVCAHAQASRVEVLLEESDGGVVVTIRDDGRGFTVEHGEPAPPGHLGLMVMRERAEQTGGWCEVESAPGHGTTVRYRVEDASLRRPAGDPAPSEAVLG
jgi:signal transduction histidine kinase